MNKNDLALTLTLLVLLTQGVTTSAASLISNGDFSSPDVAPGTHQNFGPGNAIGAWTVLDFQVSLIDGNQGNGNIPIRPAGKQHVELGHAFLAGGIAQDFAVTGNGCLSVSFSLGGNRYGAPASGLGEVDVSVLRDGSLVWKQRFSQSGTTFARRTGVIGNLPEGTYRLEIQNVAGRNAHVADVAVETLTTLQAQAVATVDGGMVTSISVTTNGCGYTRPPVVMIVGAGGTGAKAVAQITNGIVYAIVITDPGSGYTVPPVVLIGSPDGAPKLSISVSRVMVNMHVTLGRLYQLESSSDFQTWAPVGVPFVAESESISEEFEVAETGDRKSVV